MKYSKRFNEDYQFYYDNRHKFTFCGREFPGYIYDKQGVSAKEAFYSLDTFGDVIPTKEPELLVELAICKSSINWHIKNWAEGYEDMKEPFETYMKEFINPPAWVEKAQIGRAHV